MKKKWLILLVIPLVTMTMIAASPNVRIGERLNLPVGYSEMSFPANEPFHLSGGITWLPAKYTDAQFLGKMQVRLEVDGEEVKHDYVEFTPYKYDGELYFEKFFVFNFPEGLEGEHTIQMFYSNKCKLLIYWGLVTECEKPEKSIEVLLRDAVVTFE
ncbi:MAG: hypothetical protein GWN30_17320 [Gammaproteobacteria bacterium]|nr:hypothetical protein [Gammaproteobacteria bacterium]